MRLLSISPPKLETSAWKRDKYCYKQGANESRLKFSRPNAISRRTGLFGLWSRLLLEIRIRNRRAQFVDNIQREQCCNNQSQQNADDRAKCLTPLRRTTRPKPATPTTFVAAIGLVRRQGFDELLAESTSMRSVGNVPAAWTKHTAQESSFFGGKKTPRLL